MRKEGGGKDRIRGGRKEWEGEMEEGKQTWYLEKVEFKNYQMSE